MHELSIAQNIIEIVHQNVPADELEYIEFVKLKIGDLAGVVTDSLTFGFETLIIDTPLQNSKLSIENIPFKVLCNSCNNVFSNEFGITICSECNNTDTKVLAGTELQVIEVQLKEKEVLS
jgi:hydrogenase nickel incorporation protein HypA/HybF